MKSFTRTIAVLGTTVAITGAMSTTAAFADSKAGADHIIPCPQQMGAPGQNDLGNLQGWLYTTPYPVVDAHASQGVNFVAAGGCIGLVGHH